MWPVELTLSVCASPHAGIPARAQSDWHKDTKDAACPDGARMGEEKKVIF